MMIEHLRGREKALEPLGWTGPEAEWIALVCLHSGVFTRAQFCHYFETQRMTASRFVKTLINRKAAVENEWPVFNGGGKSCRISSKPIYRALGVENIRHRRKARPPVVMRRLLSLDYVLEHPGMNWLAIEFVARRTPCRPVAKLVAPINPLDLDRLMNSGEEPQIWLGQRNEGDDEIAPEVLLGLPRLPPVESALKVDLKRVFLAVPTREVKLAALGCHRIV